jgi:shikimate kinase
MTLIERLQGINLYLIGMMGAGKSSTGLQLADRLGYRFFDTDAVLEAATGQTIPAIFEHQGEAAFRQMETQVLAELSAYQKLVIATGGGIVTQKINWSYLHHGIVVWLDVPLEVLEQRLAGDMGRPLLQTQDWQATLQQLLDQRRQLYAQADVQVSVAANEGVEEIVGRILDQIQERIRPETDSPVAN